MEDQNTILLVDDDEALIKIVSLQLTDQGYRVVSALDGDEAIIKLEQKRYDLILLDIGMVRVGGYEVLGFVKKKFPETKVIMLTGFADILHAHESKVLGADEFLSKPYDLNELLTTIRAVVG